MKKNLILIILLLTFGTSVLFCLSTIEITPKGGNPIKLSSSIEESKMHQTFVEEYNHPIFTYKDSLLDIKFVFQDAYIEHGRFQKRHLIHFGKPEYVVASQTRYFIAHFSSEANLDDYYRVGETYNSPIHYKWQAMDQYYIHNHDLTNGFGAIGRGACDKDTLSDTITFVIKHNFAYYHALRMPAPFDSPHDTIGVIKFIKKY